MVTTSFLASGASTMVRSLGDRLETVLHHADVLEEAGDLPHDPVRHALQAQHEAHRQGDGAGRHRIDRPQPQRGGGDREQQGRVETVERHGQQRHEAQLLAHRVEEVRHAFLRVAVLAVGMREHLHGRDVRVGVDDAPGHHRARVRLDVRDLAQPRNEVAHGDEVAGEPQEQRRRQSHVGRREQEHRAGEVDRDVEQHLGDLHDHLAHRHGGLHHLGGDAPGEVVVEEGHRLAQHVAVRLPARAHGEARDQSLVDDRLVEELQRRQHEQHDGAHDEEERPVRLPERGAIGLRQPIDEIAEEAEQRHLDQRDRRRQRRRQADQRPEGPRVVEDESPKARRRHRGLLGGEGFDAVFQPAKHAGDHDQLPARWAVKK